MVLNIDKSEFQSLFGKQINQLRKEKKLSFRQLSLNCDIDYSDLSKIEKGKKNIQLSTILELCKGLDKHPKELFSFDLENDAEQDKS